MPCFGVAQLEQGGRVFTPLLMAKQSLAFGMSAIYDDIAKSHLTVALHFVLTAKAVKL